MWQKYGTGNNGEGEDQLLIVRGYQFLEKENKTGNTSHHLLRMGAFQPLDLFKPFEALKRYLIVFEQTPN